MSDRDRLLALITQINVWKKAGERAPHKPLFLLNRLACILRGGSEEIYFDDVEWPIKALLEEFGPHRQSYHPEYPFWYLQSDELWEVYADAELECSPSHARPKISEIRSKHAKGRFPEWVRRCIASEPNLASGLVQELLASHFPTALHGDLLEALGIEQTTMTKTTDDDAKDFRATILHAYNHRCAVSNFDAQFNCKSIGLEVAMIRWPQAGGEKRVQNGIALTALHKKLFYKGCFTIDKSYSVKVSPRLTNGGFIADQLRDSQARQIMLPSDNTLWPSQNFLEWHRKEVFKG